MNSDAAINPPHLQLLVSEGCHLCQQARRDLDEVTGPLGLAWDEVNVAHYPELEERFALEIPVVLVNGTPRDFWRIDKNRLRTILRGLVAGGDPEGADGR